MNANPLLKLWSVTTLISNGTPMGRGLQNYIVRQPSERAYDRLSLLQQYHRDGDRDGAVKWLMDARWEKSKKAMARGSEIHAIAEAIALGQDYEVAAEVLPYVEQYRCWLHRWQPTFEMAEAPVYNPAWSYAGTCDGVMELQGQRVIFDYKTTEYPPDGEKARPPWPDVALQLVAYARASFVGVLSEQRYSYGRRYYLFDPQAEHEPMPPVDGAVCIVISPYDCIAVPVGIGDDVWESFLDVRAAARWTLETSQRGLFGPPLATTKRPQLEEV